jgi:3-isopropylmalate/(R)-2-methylmalate dehydratase large subunit
MGMTMTEKILARAGGLPAVSPGDVVVVDVETACLIDLSFLPEGWRRVLKVADPSKVVIVFDHLVPAPTAQAAACMQTARAFAREFGIERLPMSAQTRASATRSSPTRRTRCPAPFW